MQRRTLEGRKTGAKYMKPTVKVSLFVFSTPPRGVGGCLAALRVLRLYPKVLTVLEAYASTVFLGFRGEAALRS